MDRVVSMGAPPISAASANIRALGLVLFATLGLALKGIWAKLAYAQGATVESVLFYRAAFSFPLILLTARWFAARLESEVIPFRWSHLTLGCLMGAFFSIGMYCDFQSIFYLGAGVSRVILFGYPLIILILEALLLRSWPNPAKLIGFFVAWLGLLLVCGVLSRGAALGSYGSSSQVGELTAPALNQLGWGVAALILYAAYVFASGKLSVIMGSSRLSLYSNAATSIVVVSILLVSQSGGIPQVARSALAWIVVMVLVSTVVPYFLMMEGIRRVGAVQASLTAMVGPVVTLLAGALVLGETLAWSQIAGAMLTLAGVFVVQKKQPKTRQ